MIYACWYWLCPSGWGGASLLQSYFFLHAYLYSLEGSHYAEPPTQGVGIYGPRPWGQSTGIHYLEFFCMGDLPHLLICSTIYSNMDSWILTLYFGLLSNATLFYCLNCSTFGLLKLLVGFLCSFAITTSGLCVCELILFIPPSLPPFPQKGQLFFF